MTITIKAYLHENGQQRIFGVRLGGVFYENEPGKEVAFVQYGPESRGLATFTAELDGAIQDYTGAAGNITEADVQAALDESETVSDATDPSTLIPE